MEGVLYGSFSFQDKRKERELLKRENKNRPREMSSKKTVSRFRDVVGVSSAQNAKVAAKRDPRFDSLCGDFDEKVGVMIRLEAVCLAFTSCFFRRSSRRATNSWTTSRPRRGSSWRRS